MADSQLGFREVFRDGHTGWEEERQIVQLAIQEINRLKPAFAIVCGDMINEWPASDTQKRGNGDKRASQVKDFNEVVSEIDPSIPLVCVCGNHDVGNRPSQATIDEYRKDFGEEFFSFWIRGCKCIVVNSMLWKDDSDAKEIRNEHDAWMESELASAVAEGAAHIFVFGHIPAFIDSPTEDVNQFNIEIGFRTELLELWAKYGVSHYFSGHYHRNAGGLYKSQSTGKTVEVVVTGAVGTNIVDRPGNKPVALGGFGDPVLGRSTSGLRLVTVQNEKTVSHKWYNFDDLAKVQSL